jgi:hypothetical protein
LSAGSADAAMAGQGNSAGETTREATSAMIVGFAICP